MHRFFFWIWEWFAPGRSRNGLSHLVTSFPAPDVPGAGSRANCTTPESQSTILSCFHGYISLFLFAACGWQSSRHCAVRDMLRLHVALLPGTQQHVHRTRHTACGPGHSNEISVIVSVRVYCMHLCTRVPHVGIDARPMWTHVTQCTAA